jgi:hypothetical protein
MLEREKKRKQPNGVKIPKTKINREEAETQSALGNSEDAIITRMNPSSDQAAPAEKPEKNEGVDPGESSVTQLLPFSSRKPIADKQNIQIVEAEIFETEMRVRSLAAGSDREYFLELLAKARDALVKNEPRIIFAQRLVEIVNKNIGFRSTILPHILGLAILLVELGAVALLTWNTLIVGAFGTPVWNILLAFTIGTAGGAVSLTFDFPKLFRRGQPAVAALVKVVLRPFIGGFLAAFLFSLLAGGFLNMIIPPLIQISLSGYTSSQIFYIILSMSFLFGFTERIPAMIIERAMRSGEKMEYSAAH